MPMRQIVEEFLEWGRPTWAPKTYRDGYGSPLRGKLVPWAEQEGIATLEELSLKVGAFSSYLMDAYPDLAPASRKSYLKAVNQLLSWGTKEMGWEAKGRAKLPRLRKKKKDVLSEAEARSLEAAATTERDRLIIALAFATGARLSEIANLRADHVKKSGGDHYVAIVETTSAEHGRYMPKSGERLSPISQNLYRRLQNYIERLRPRSSDPHLFLAERRRDGRYRALGAHAIYGIIKDAAERSGIKKRVHPHLLRASAITHLLSSGKMTPSMVVQTTGASLAVIMEFYDNPSQEATWRAYREVFTEED